MQTSDPSKQTKPPAYPFFNQQCQKATKDTNQQRANISAQPPEPSPEIRRTKLNTRPRKNQQHIRAAGEALSRQHKQNTQEGKRPRREKNAIIPARATHMIDFQAIFLPAHA
ncbi:MAG: hypothetical protein JJT95_19350 [Pararhodobacter sp.]|nr:hypothetical protein [Pararhodobacter sp.]